MKTKSGREIVAWIVREGNVRGEGRYQGTSPDMNAQGDVFANWGPRKKAYRAKANQKSLAESWARRGGNGRVVPIVKRQNAVGDMLYGQAKQIVDLEETVRTLIDERDEALFAGGILELRASLARLTPLPVPDANDELVRELTFWKNKAQQAERYLHVYEQTDNLISKAADILTEIRTKFASPEHQTTLNFVMQAVEERGRALAEVETLGRTVQEYVREIDERKTEVADKKIMLESALSKLANRLPDLKVEMQRVDNEIWNVIKMNREFL